jgi:hypothetical protein
MRTRPSADDAELTAPLPRIRDHHAEDEAALGGETEAEAELDVGEDDGDAPPRRSRRDAGAGQDGERRLPRRRPPRSALIALGTVLGLVVLLLGLWSVPSIRTTLRQSFTRLPTGYTEIYFTSAPTVNGADLNIPVTVVAHATQAKSVAVKVWLVNQSGATRFSTTVTLAPKNGVASTVVTLKAPADAQVVWVSLPGKNETLHYRLAGVAYSVPPSPTRS